MLPYREWSGQAACNDIKNPDVFFPSKGSQAKGMAVVTRLICQTCPVQKDCLDYSIAHDEEGFWGGKTEHERGTFPDFLVEHIKSEYERLGLYQPRLRIDDLILLVRASPQEVQLPEDEFS